MVHSSTQFCKISENPLKSFWNWSFSNLGRHSGNSSCFWWSKLVISSSFNFGFLKELKEESIPRKSKLNLKNAVKRSIGSSLLNETISSFAFLGDWASIKASFEFFSICSRRKTSQTISQTKCNGAPEFFQWRDFSIFKKQRNQKRPCCFRAMTKEPIPPSSKRSGGEQEFIIGCWNQESSGLFLVGLS